MRKSNSVQPGATDKLGKAIVSADSTYNGTAAVSVFIAQARQEQAYSHFISPQASRVYPISVSQIIYGLLLIPLSLSFQLRDILQAAQLSFRNKNAQSLSHTNFNLSNVMQNAPQTILDPFGFDVIDLRPFDVPVYVKCIQLFSKLSQSYLPRNHNNVTQQHHCIDGDWLDLCGVCSFGLMRLSFSFSCDTYYRIVGVH